MKIEIYSDIACPWCYIGEHRLATALADFPHRDAVEITYRPFQLDPAAPPGARPLLDALAEKFGQTAEQKLAQVTSAARAEGIEMRWAEAKAVNTLSAHRLIGLAGRELGPTGQRALADALFAAYFTDGGDLSDPGTLTELAVAAGLDRERVTAFLASDEGADEVRAEIDQAHQMGIGAVPTFVFEGRYALQGAQPASVFRDALAEIHNRLTTAPVSDTAESCADDACAV